MTWWPPTASRSRPGAWTPPNGDGRSARGCPRSRPSAASSRAIFYSTYFGSAAAPRMRSDVEPVFDDFRPDLVVSEIGELGTAPLASSRGIPRVTVAFSGPLPESAIEMTLAALAPLWAGDGITDLTPATMFGDLYLDPFPPSFSRLPDGVAARRMRRAEPPPRAPEPEWLTALGSLRPLVYLTSGTEPAAKQAPWAPALAALATLDVDAVATIGAFVDPADLGPIPDNVRIERYVDQQHVLSRVSVVASHAGAGSMLAAANAGLPPAPQSDRRRSVGERRCRHRGRRRDHVRIGRADRRPHRRLPRPIDPRAAVLAGCSWRRRRAGGDARAGGARRGDRVARCRELIRAEPFATPSMLDGGPRTSPLPVGRRAGSARRLGGARRASRLEHGLELGPHCDADHPCHDAARTQQVAAGSARPMARRDRW